MAGVREAGNLYQYNNVRNIGFVIFLIILFVEQLILLGSVNYGIIGSVDMLLNSANFFSVIVLPAAFITFILVTVSNIQLMKNEGRNWKNMLGCILGIMVCVGTVFPRILGEFLQQTTIVDVHNQNGVALYMELFVENAILAATAYLECILIGTIFLSTKAARKIPSFDKDYILILGCQIKKDGTLTNLLKSRADRAVEFAKMQKNVAGKNITFIPSGGKGNDEIIAEADAIKNYLVSIGIPENSILVENKSQNFPKTVYLWKTNLRILMKISEILWNLSVIIQKMMIRKSHFQLQTIMYSDLVFLLLVRESELKA